MGAGEGGRNIPVQAKFECNLIEGGAKGSSIIIIIYAYDNFYHKGEGGRGSESYHRKSSYYSLSSVTISVCPPSPQPVMDLQSPNLALSPQLSRGLRAPNT